VKEYGVVEAEGTSGYDSAGITLRAPRMAVRVESGDHWQSMFALAMWMAAGWWGSHGDEDLLHVRAARDEGSQRLAPRIHLFLLYRFHSLIRSGMPVT
jgi:hypothetical protein